MHIDSEQITSCGTKWNAPGVKQTATHAFWFAGSSVSSDGAGANSRWGHIKVHYLLLFHTGLQQLNEHYCINDFGLSCPIEHRGRPWLGWRPLILVGMAFPPRTTASDGSISTCLPASSWTWPWLCLLRACLSSKCQYRWNGIITGLAFICVDSENH